MSLCFTNSLGATTQHTHIELTSILTNLNSTNTYFTNGFNQLAFIRLSVGRLLLVYLYSNSNIKLFETFSFQY